MTGPQPGRTRRDDGTAGDGPDPRLVRAVLSLYPRRWRDRYGDEFAALLTDMADAAPWPARAGLLANAIQNMQELGWISFGTMQLWNSARFLSEDSTLGDILHTFVGYAEAPTALQASLYIGYLLLAGSVFAWMTRKPPVPAKATVRADRA